MACGADASPRSALRSLSPTLSLGPTVPQPSAFPTLSTGAPASYIPLPVQAAVMVVCLLCLVALAIVAKCMASPNWRLYGYLNKWCQCQCCEVIGAVVRQPEGLGLG